jgi:hypothetical protein
MEFSKFDAAELAAQVNYLEKRTSGDGLKKLPRREFIQVLNARNKAFFNDPMNGLLSTLNELIRTFEEFEPEYDYARVDRDIIANPEGFSFQTIDEELLKVTNQYEPCIECKEYLTELRKYLSRRIAVEIAPSKDPSKPNMRDRIQMLSIPSLAEFTAAVSHLEEIKHAVLNHSVPLQNEEFSLYPTFIGGIPFAKEYMYYLVTYMMYLKLDVNENSLIQHVLSLTTWETAYHAFRELLLDPLRAVSTLNYYHEFVKRSLIFRDTGRSLLDKQQAAKEFIRLFKFRALQKGHDIKVYVVHKPIIEKEGKCDGKTGDHYSVAGIQHVWTQRFEFVDTNIPFQRMTNFNV